MSRLNPGYFTFLSCSMMSSVVTSQIRVVMRRSRANRNGAQAHRNHAETHPDSSSLPFQSAAPALAQRDIGTVEVAADNRTIPVRVSGATPELNALALQAFGAHGRYHLVAERVTSTTSASRPAGAGAGARRHLARLRRRLRSRPRSRRGRAQRERAPRRGRRRRSRRRTGSGCAGFFTSKLVFIGERTGHQEIYTSDLFFGDVTQITHDRAIAMTPRWSPDGERIIYTSFFKSGFPDIFEIDLGGYQRTTFVSFKGTNSGAHFSPDGRQVAMVLSGEGEPEIYVSNAYGRGVSAQDPLGRGEGVALLVARRLAPHLRAWSPARSST